MNSQKLKGTIFKLPVSYMRIVIEIDCCVVFILKFIEEELLLARTTFHTDYSIINTRTHCSPGSINIVSCTSATTQCFRVNINIRYNSPDDWEYAVYFRLRWVLALNLNDIHILLLAYFIIHSVPLIARYIALSRLCSSPQARIILATRPSEVPPGKKVKGIRLTALQSDLVRSPFTVSWIIPSPPRVIIASY